MRGSPRRRIFAGLCLLLVWQSGCAAFRPIQGVPARYLPTEMKVGERSGRRTINVSLLGQSPPPAHLIDSGDVLGVYVEGFVGKSSDPPPVYFPVNNEIAPSFGLPYPVREDGTISLPFVGSINLRGLTLVQAEERVKQAYLVPKQLIRPDFHRVQVNLQRPRQYRVLVIRQDSRAEPQSVGMMGQLNIGMAKRGTGKVVNLPAYSNDVLNALTASDGLPGLDAENAVYVIRRRGNATGGALDSRWPTDLDPAVLMRQGAAVDAPVIRGQSSDNESGYLHSQNVMRTLYADTEGRGVQQAAAHQEVGRNGYYPAHPGTSPNTSLEPQRIWSDRMANAPVAFEPESRPTGNTVGTGSARFSVQLPGVVIPRELANAQRTYADSYPGTIPAANESRPHQTFTDPVDARMGSQPYGPVTRASNGQSWNGDPTAPGYGPPQLYGTQLPGTAPDGPSMSDPTMSGDPTSSSVTSGTPGIRPLPNESSTYRLPAGNSAVGGAPQRGLAVDERFDAGHGLPGVGTLDGRQVIRIPIRLGPGETADIRPEDVVLYDGDIVFIESRDTEVFYTAGLLGGGQFTLPRDYDLDILQALSLAQSRGMSGGGARSVGGVSALNNDVSISPSTAIVLRKLPDGGEIPVKVDLYRARTDLAERIVIQPGDYILLQYTPLEAVAAFVERHLLETALFGVASQQFRSGN